MSKGKFEKAVEIIRSLPKEGPIQPSQDDQLYVRTPFFFRVVHPIWVNMFALTTLDVSTRRSSILTINKVRVRGTITRVFGPHFPESSH